MRTIETPYGPLTVTHYAGPTTAPGHGYLNDGKYPRAAHALGRAPDEPSMGARVRTPDGATLAINGVRYHADATFTLVPSLGWRVEYGIYHPLNRADVPFMAGAPTDGARKAWIEKVLPLVISTLTADTESVDACRAAARLDFIADCRKVAAELRAEADRLDALTED